MKHPFLPFTILILTFCVGTYFVYLTYFKLDVQNPIPTTDSKKPINPDWDYLRSFENKDLTKLGQEDYKKLKIVLNRLGAKGQERSQLGFFSQISNAKGETYYVLIGMINPAFIPGKCELQIQLFDLNGNFLKNISFDSGWRQELTKVEVVVVPSIGRKLIIAESRPFFGGSDLLKQYYGLVNDDIFTIRLENSKGKSVPNSSYGSSTIIGKYPPQKAEQEWLESLESIHIIEVLANLNWLSIRNDYSSINDDRVNFLNKIRANQTIKSKIVKFSSSDNKWLRDSANLILNPKISEK